MSSSLLKALKLCRVLRVKSFRRTFRRFRVVASVEHQNVLQRLGTIRSVIDIGANRGQFALMARFQYPDAQLISFEPLGGPANIYRQVFAGDQRVRLHQVAIGPELAEVQIHIAARDDSSSLLPISDLQAKTFAGTAEIDTASITVKPLDAVLSSADISTPALLKVDVQGYEYEALQGCESLLSRFNYIYCECSFVELYAGQRLADSVVDWLFARGFFLQGIYNLFHDSSGLAIQADFLFSRR